VRYGWLLVALAVAACATTPPEPPPFDPWAAAQAIVRALPPAGQQKWNALTPAQQAELVRVAEPFLRAWAAGGDPRALAVVLATFSATWNARVPDPPVHCTLLHAIVCF